MSAFLADGLNKRGLDSVLIETRRVHAALSAVPIKTDLRDACGIAELLRNELVSNGSLEGPRCRDLRLTLSVRDTLGRRVRELDTSVRRLLRGFGLRVPIGARGQFFDLVRDLTEGTSVLLSARTAMAEEFAKLDELVRGQSYNDDFCRRLMGIPGVGAVAVMAVRAAIDDPKRFRSSNSVGVWLTPRRYQTNETDRVTLITKAGDASVQAALYKQRM